MIKSKQSRYKQLLLKLRFLMFRIKRSTIMVNAVRLKGLERPIVLEIQLNHSRLLKNNVIYLYESTTKHQFKHKIVTSLSNIYITIP